MNSAVVIPVFCYSLYTSVAVIFALSSAVTHDHLIKQPPRFQALGSFDRITDAVTVVGTSNCRVASTPPNASAVW